MWRGHLAISGDPCPPFLARSGVDSPPLRPLLTAFRAHFDLRTGKQNRKRIVFDLPLSAAIINNQSSIINDSFSMDLSKSRAKKTTRPH
jgi:hypothetical protein